MGEIADDMIAGLACSECGMYFTKKNGYPVLCDDCWDDESELSQSTHLLELPNQEN